MARAATELGMDSHSDVVTKWPRTTAISANKVGGVDRVCDECEVFGAHPGNDPELARACRMDTSVKPTTVRTSTGLGVMRPR
jgi:hypothetical protein